MFLILEVDFKGLKVMPVVLAVPYQLSVGAALCCKLLLAVRSQLEQIPGVCTERHSSEHVNCNVFQQRVGIIRSSAWKRRNVRPHSGRCASGNRHLCLYLGTKRKKIYFVHLELKKKQNRRPHLCCGYVHGKEWQSKISVFIVALGMARGCCDL